MKISLITKCLNQYDEGKGTLRMFKDESHIAKLRTLHNTLGGNNALDRELTDKELFELVNIILDKKTWNESASAKALSEIIAELGGKEAYDYLFENKCLTQENVAFLAKTAPFFEKNSKRVHGLAILVNYSALSVPPLPFDILHQESVFFDLTSMVDKVQCMSNLKSKGLLSKQALLLVARCQDVTITEELIGTLHKQGLFNDVNLELLSKHPDALDAILQIIKTLNNREVFPIGFCDLGKVFTFDVATATNFSLYLGYIEQQYKKNRVSGEVGVTLLANAEKMAQQNSNITRTVLTLFQEQEWPVTNYLQYFFAIKGHDLQYTLVRMAKCKLETSLLTLVLEALKTSPEDYQMIIKGVMHLKENTALNEGNLKFILSNCPYAHSLAVALTQSSNLVKKPIEQSELLKFPQFAEKVVGALLELEKLDKNDLDALHPLVISKPECAEAAKSIFQLLKRQDTLLNKIVIEFFYRNPQLINKTCYDTLTALEEAKILTFENIIRLSLNKNYLKTITSACITLNNAPAKEYKSNSSCTLLNQSSFEKIIKDPANSLKFAESSGGKLRHHSMPVVQDEGARNYVTIRTKARLLAQGQRQGLFFEAYTTPMVKSGDKYPIPPLTLEERQALEKSSVIHIAKFLGDGIFLEKEVETTLAKQTVEEIFEMNTKSL